MAKPDQLSKMLSVVPLFQGLSGRELELIASTGMKVTHEAGRSIVEQGTGGVGFHLILEGEARVESGGKELARIGPGRFFGEMSLLDGEPRMATVTAETPVVTFSLASWDFSPLIERHPSIARKLLVELSRRIRDMSESPLD